MAGVSFSNEKRNLLFMSILAVSDDPEEDLDEVEKLIKRGREEMEKSGDEIPQTLWDAWKYWEDAFAEARAFGEDDNAILAWNVKYLYSEHPACKSEFKIVQGLMKASIHVMWRNLMCRYYGYRRGLGFQEMGLALRMAMGETYEDIARELVLRALWPDGLPPELQAIHDKALAEQEDDDWVTDEEEDEEEEEEDEEA